MTTKILTDNHVLFSLGLFCFTISYALERIPVTGAAIDFLRGVLVGMSAATFGIAIIVTVAQASRKTQVPEM